MLIRHDLETRDFLLLREDFLDRVVENGGYYIVSTDLYMAKYICVCDDSDIHCSAGVECALERIACVDLPRCCQLLYIYPGYIRYIYPVELAFARYHGVPMLFISCVLYCLEYNIHHEQQTPRQSWSGGPRRCGGRSFCTWCFTSSMFYEYTR